MIVQRFFQDNVEVDITKLPDEVLANFDIQIMREVQRRVEARRPHNIVNIQDWRKTH